MRLSLLDTVLGRLVPLITSHAALNYTAFEQLNSSYTESNGSFLVCAGKIDITPEPNPQWLPLNVYAFECMYVRAIVWQSAGVYGAIINCEDATAPDQVYTYGNKYVADFLNTSTSNVLFGFTHSHGVGPSGNISSLSYGGGVVNGYENIGLVGLAAVKIALTNMKPAKVGYNNGTAHFGVKSCHINNLTGRWTQASNFSGPVDPSVQVLSFVGRNDGIPIATYTSYAVHPVNSYLSGHTNGDWPGAMMRWVEQAFDDRDEFVALVSLSASADVNPWAQRTSANSLAAQQNIPLTGLERTLEPVEEPLRDGHVPMTIPQVKYSRQLLDVIQAMGTLLGEQMIRLMSTTEEWHASPQVYSRQALTTCRRVRLDSAREGVPGVYTTGGTTLIRTGILAIDDIVLACVGSGIYTDIDYAIKSNSTLPKTMVVAMINGQTASGYLVAANTWEQETFQARNAKIVPGPCGHQNVSLPLGAMIAQSKDMYLS